MLQDFFYLFFYLLKLSNTISELNKFFKKFLKEYNQSAFLVCCEFTGHYTYPLCFVCEDLGIDLWLASPYQIKHSCGLVRGKTDKIDSRRIADYAFRFQDKCRLYSLPDKKLASLKVLVSERDLYVSHKIALQGQLTDQKNFMSAMDYSRKSKRLKGLLKGLDKNISTIDKEIEKFINNDATLSNQHKLLTSVDGVGTITAAKMIAVTNAFKNFDDARSFCCYAGVAPFEYTSGSSVHSKRKVSHKADKSIKSILHMAAMSVLRMKNSELKKYFDRKVAEGKNKMLVLNAIRGKLILRMFAVIKQNRTFDKNYQHAVA